MATDYISATLVCCLLAISFAMAQTQIGNSTLTSTTTPDLYNTTSVTSSNSTVNATIVSNGTEHTTPFTSTTEDNKTFNQTTSHTQTSLSTTIMSPVTNSTSLMTTPGNHTPTVTPANLTTPGYNSTPDTTVFTTAYSSDAANTTSDSEEKTTKGLGLNMSEKSMTVVFSVILGLFAIGLVVLMFHKCKHKFQYLHQPLTNTGDTDAFVADDDTLVISGGLYDGHPIYDNVPSAPADQSQFRLEFLH